MSRQLAVLLFTFFLHGPFTVAAQPLPLFADKMPSETFFILSAPDCQAAWNQLGGLGERFTGQSLGKDSLSSSSLSQARKMFQEGLSASELALWQDQQANLKFLWLGRIREGAVPARLLERFQAESDRQPGALLQSVEAIGAGRLSLFQNSESALAFLQHGPGKWWGFSNHPETLRKMARKIEGKTVGLGVPQESLAAWAEAAQGLKIQAADGKAYPLRYFYRPVQTIPGIAAASWAQWASPLSPRAESLGLLAFQNPSLVVRSFSLYPEGKGGIQAALYQNAPDHSILPGAELAPPDVIFLNGNRLLDLPRIQAFLKEHFQDWEKRLTPEPDVAPSPSQTEAAQRLKKLKGWMEEGSLWNTFGPAWFCFLEDLTFQERGGFPRLDFALGVETRSTEKCHILMGAMESRLCRLYQENFATSQAPVAFTTSTLNLPDREWPCRVLKASNLPSTLQPCWAQTGRWVLVALRPETLERALERGGRPYFERAEGVESEIVAEEEVPPDPAGHNYLDFRKSIAMETCHAYQIIQPEKVLPAMLALLKTLENRLPPRAREQALVTLQTLNRIERVLIFRQGEGQGVRLFGEIRLKPSPDGL